MYISEKKNNSGSISIQIVSKVRGKYKLVKTVAAPLSSTK
jgi:hypothetical protein